VPATRLQLLPGDGRVGAALVNDPRIAGVAFTGGTETARSIARDLAARPGPIRAVHRGDRRHQCDDRRQFRIARTGGGDVLTSAFGSAGQRCSSLRLLCLQEDVADRMLTMLRGAAEMLVIGDPLDPATDIGPVIDQEALAALEDYAAAMGPPLFH
jgi:RHH-type proline utilization regulon transcriptional repressor/proline dehydrogenase/delta 1-pyrroline-5-carboxylate dehydrogenase